MSELDRREFLQGVALAAGAVGVAGCRDERVSAPQAARAVAPPSPPVVSPAPLPEPSVATALPAASRERAVSAPLLPRVTTEPLRGPPWATSDPFLFCVHHLDAYPAGDGRMAPAAALAGRRLGQDFSRRDGWSMYHGRVVPGFPRHPHRGFETVTVTRTGFVDHSDSLGATARYGGGDTQWMTAGRGIAHAEMFPLRERGRANPLELFQIWLNLPARSKFVDPYFTMMWAHTIPVHRVLDPGGRAAVITTVAGAFAGQRSPAPPPQSWASVARAEIAIWTIVLEPGATWTLPAARDGVERSRYFFRGDQLTVAGQAVSGGRRIRLQPDRPAPLQAGASTCELLMLQGRPIGEPVVSHGPFVMNTREEIRQAYADYRSGSFGGWPWSSDAPVHPSEQGRFAVHADGRRETPA